MTTNERLGRLHEAVARPGRCAAAVEFEAFSAEEAGAWLGRESEDGATLAELFARRAGLELPRQRRRIGFAH